MGIRSSVKAIIFKDNKILTIKKRDKEGEIYILPGGGQEFGETLIEAIRREVKEEVGSSICNENLVFVREYIGKNHEFKDRDKNIHIVDHIFLCSIQKEDIYELQPDEDQIGFEWINVNELGTYKFYPKELINRIKNLGDDIKNNIYTGDLN